MNHVHHHICTCEQLEARRLLALTVPAFSSLPGAQRTIYLDFDGSAPFSWSNNQGTFAIHGPGPTTAPVPAFDTDDDNANFSAGELSSIQDIWSWASEKYSPFQVNVTTVDPGTPSVHVLIGGSASDWYDGTSGGTSKIGGWGSSPGNTCFAFSLDAVTNLLEDFGISRVEQFLGETCAHEAGHEWGLVHERTPDGSGGTSAYYPGDATRAPIMGGSSNNTSGARGIWWKTNNFTGQNSPDPVQDELDKLAGAGGPLTYRNDDYSFASPATLNVLSDGSILNPPTGVNGVIGNTADTDPWQFTATSNRITLTIDNALLGGMLAPTAYLRLVSTGATIFSTVTQANTTVSISSDQLTPGAAYQLVIGSQGEYGDIGQYRISGSMQTFAYYDPILRTVNVGGISGANNITISVAYNGAGDPGLLTVSDSFSGGTSSQQFPLAGLIMVKVTLGGSDDVLDARSLVPLIGGTAPPLFVDMGGGADVLELDASPITNATFEINSNTLMTYANTPMRILGGVEQVLLLGTVGNDNFNVHSWGYGRTLVAFGGSSDDLMTIDQAVSNTPGALIDFDGGAQTDTLTIPVVNTYAGSSTSVLGYNPDYAIQWGVDGGYIRQIQFSGSVETVAIVGTANSDNFSVADLPSTTTVSISGNGGDDNLQLGYTDPLGFFSQPFSDYTFGNVSFLGGAGTDAIYIDDRDHAGALAYTVTTASFKSNLSGMVSWNDTTDYLQALGVTSYGSIFDVSFGGYLSGLALYGGNASDGFYFSNCSMPNITVDGGAGADSLSIDDRGGTWLYTHIDYWPDHIDRFVSNGFGEFNYRFDFANIESPIYYVWDNVHSVNIYGVQSLPLGFPLTFVMGTGDDAVTVYPHDAQGNLTINGNLNITGGAGIDSVTINDTASSLPINYGFSNPGGNSTQDIAGMGAGLCGILNDVDHLYLNAGGGDDTFDFSTYQSFTPLSVNAGGGDDAFTLPGNVIRSFSQWITLWFMFDGGAGNDSFTLNDQSNATGGWTYFVRGGAVPSIERYQNFGPDAGVNIPNIEMMTINSGAQADSLALLTLAAGTSLFFNGGDGNDAVLAGLSTSLPEIQGAVWFDGQNGAGDNVRVSYNAAETAQTVHITQSGIGAFPGDNFFGAGGSIHFASTVEQVTVTGGSGPDTFYVQPSSFATISVTAGSPTTSPGDTLILALAGVQNYVLNGSPASGSLTSSNRMPLSYGEFEGNANIDATAPAAQAGILNLDGIVVGAVRRQSIDVQFSENIGLITPSSLLLTNLTTGQIIPSSSMAVAFDAATNVAHFTFPGQPYGALPDGEYHLTLEPTYADAFGNAAADPFESDIFSLAGDANHDRSVNSDDFNIFATNFGTSGNVFSGGDFNYDGLINSDDFNILATRFGVTLTGPSFSASRITVPPLPRIIRELSDDAAS